VTPDLLFTVFGFTFRLFRVDGYVSGPYHSPAKYVCKAQRIFYIVLCLEIGLVLTLAPWIPQDFWTERLGQ